MKIAIYFAIASILLSFGQIYIHELNHQNIFEDYGIPSTIHIGFPDWYVTPDISTQSCDSNCNIAHSINDSIGYNIQGITIIIFLGLFCLIALLEEKK